VVDTRQLAAVGRCWDWELEPRIGPDRSDGDPVPRMGRTRPSFVGGSARVSLALPVRPPGWYARPEAVLVRHRRPLAPGHRRIRGLLPPVPSAFVRPRPRIRPLDRRLRRRLAVLSTRDRRRPSTACLTPCVPAENMGPVGIEPTISTL